MKWGGSATTSNQPNRRRFLDCIFPPPRPKEEWEHVHVTRNGTRYVIVKEMLADPRVQSLIRQAADIKVESSRPNPLVREDRLRMLEEKVADLESDAHRQNEEVARLKRENALFSQERDRR